MSRRQKRQMGIKRFWYASPQEVAEARRREQARQERKKKVAAKRGDIPPEVLANHEDYAGYSEAMQLYSDIKSPLKDLRKRAKDGHPDSQFSYGMRFVEGNGVKVDGRLARKWLSRAAESGHVKAQYAYGSVLASGFGAADCPVALRTPGAVDTADPNSEAHYGTPEIFDGIEWFTKAADQGSFTAQCSLIGIFYVGHAVELGVEQNYKLARHYAEMAFKSPDAHTNPRLASLLAAMHLFGHGGPKDPKKALTVLYEMEKKTHDPDVQVGLAVMIRELNIKDLYPEARQFARMAAKQGNISAHSVIIEMCREGEGGRVDNKEADKWMENLKKLHKKNREELEDEPEYKELKDSVQELEQHTKEYRQSVATTMDALSHLTLAASEDLRDIMVDTNAVPAKEQKDQTSAAATGGGQE